MTCCVCKGLVHMNDKCLRCFECSCLVHLICLPNITENDFEYIVTYNVNWKCTNCNKKRVERGDNTPVNPNSRPNKAQVRESTAHTSGNHTSTQNRVICLSCGKGFPYNNLRACCTKCKSFFHYKCAAITKEEYTKKRKWMCKKCSMTQNVLYSIQTGSTDHLTVMEVLAGIKSCIKDVEKQNEEIGNSIKANSERMLEIDVKINEIDKKMSDLLRDVDVIKECIKKFN